MPTVSVARELLHTMLGRVYTQEEFDELCFVIGIELDDVTTEKAIIRKEKHLQENEADEDEEVIYKIEVPANRYDLLCPEGICRQLRIFLRVEKMPTYRLSRLPDSSILKMIVKPETAVIRPFVVCAILRGITFDQARYASFIDLQDRLHQNICRKRTLVAIGTHDLDTLQGPFTYEALPPSEIKFIPLKQAQEFTAKELMEFYKSDLKLKKFLHIIEDSPVFPVIYDSNRTVLSLPPIINGAHSAISLNTKNVLIECTATDLTKAKIVLNTMVAMFSGYCDEKFEVEPVDVVDPVGRVTRCPDLSLRTMDVDLSYIKKSIGVPLQAGEIVDLLSKMQLTSKEIDGDKIQVFIPPTRSDILHPCDVMEDVAVAYGFNNIPKTRPKTSTEGRQQPLNEFSDLLRLELAMAGFSEVLNWVLVSKKENFTLLNRKDDEKIAAIVSNPRSSDFEVGIKSPLFHCFVNSLAFQVLRTSLLPGILKVMEHSKDVPRPVKVFEISDVVLLDPSKDVGAANSRHLAALYCSTTSGFEIIHGLLDRIMNVLNVPVDGYTVEPSNEPELFKGRQAKIFYKGSCVGSFGIIHPQVLKNFDIPDPCSYVEMEIERFL
ncbi:phenylalanine--tRNA ligase beta subunit, cytoplasmic isoform X1 [Selaginella moellendorffii]|uniref:phenylalanine--tRNA ligase beta subunit, cytoplasmic isoform X1 n=1 Tax=Selaginella moellendorffii TaxID=88036 RepID=UPI000D1CEA50|nr:phenylalanine--tRNA ligase beta subunit, cytoplasmic isoform X1 [Selaginella moellendorffii]|eukprot:XP_024526452.1 phenylalanine--tRNA ligase beta subunit, cytoplasmic isoform X1 [Selaginella moellendorffii]